MFIHQLVQWCKGRENVFFKVIFLMTVVFALVEIVMFALYRQTWIDEEIYLFKSLTILRGDFTPFRDIVVEYPPLFILLYGLPQLLFGASFYVGRFAAAVFSVAILILLFKLIKKLMNRWWALIAVLLLLSSLSLIGNYAVSALFAPTTLVLLTLLYIETTNINRSKKTILAACCLALLLLMRTNLFPAMFVYVIYLILMKAGWRNILLCFGITFGLVIAGYLPIVVFNPSLAISFILLPFHTFGTLKQVSLEFFARQDLLSFVTTLVEFIREYIVLLFLFLAVFVRFIMEMIKRPSPFAFLREERIYVLTSVLVFTLIITHFFYFGVATKVIYASYFGILFIVSALIGIYHLACERKVWVSIFVAGILLNFGVNVFRTDLVSNPLAESDLARVERGAALVRENTTPTDTLVAFDNSIFHIYAADRKTFPPLFNRNFLYVHNTESEFIKPLLLYNFDMLKQWIRSADFLLLHKERWADQFVEQGQDADKVAEVVWIGAMVNEQYKLIGTAKNVYPRKYTVGNDNDGGTLLIYKNKRMR